MQKLCRLRHRVLKQIKLFAGAPRATLTLFSSSPKLPLVIMNPYLAVRTLGMNRKSILANLSSFLFVIRKQFPPLVTVRNYFFVTIFINEPDQLSIASAPKVPCIPCEFDDSFSKLLEFPNNCF